MSSFLCVLLLGVILVACVQGLTEDQLLQNLKNGKADQIDFGGIVDGLGSKTEDHVDVEDILEQLGFQEKIDAVNDDDEDMKRVGWNWATRRLKSQKDNGLGWWYIPKQKANSVKDPAPWCQSHSSGGGCCVQRTMNVHGKTYHLNACVNVDFHPHANEYSIYFSVNGYSLFHKDTDLNMNEMEECFSASSLVPGSKICIKLYKICTKHKHMCAALEGKAVIKGVKKNVQLDYGCFQIGSVDENEDEQVPDDMETEEQATKAEMFRALSDQLDLSNGVDETSSTEDDTLLFEN
ncbi:hypothetical protein MAR_001561 [Mya arenaria]|uniref:DUF4773 domain-containing protein n=1 Tax=Mya arenaria TaxID=6604 RepID=A0ABY7FC36_MYAAR|nr:uncharacterized protein LOC128207212 [Mya arenaria]WAR19723.1 hypothetical protein MAR_001561 [Mya arenaria]